MRILMQIWILGLLVGCQVKNRVSEDPVTENMTTESGMLGEIDHISDQQMIGKYRIEGFNHGVSIELKDADVFVEEKYVWKCEGGGKVRSIKGRYSVNNDKLILSPITVNFITHEQDYPKKSDLGTVKYYTSDSTLLKTEFIILKWDSLRYLLSEDYSLNLHCDQRANDFEIFANSYNSTIEPNRNGNYFVKRPKGHVPKGDLDKSYIPSKYRAMFLEEPIISKIIDMDTLNYKTNGKQRIVRMYKLDKGSEDGVTNKMEFYGKAYCCGIRIVDVANDVSYGKICSCIDSKIYCEIGESLSTERIIN